MGLLILFGIIGALIGGSGGGLIGVFIGLMIVWGIEDRAKRDNTPHMAGEWCRGGCNGNHTDPMDGMSEQEKKKYQELNAAGDRKWKEWTQLPEAIKNREGAWEEWSKSWNEAYKKGKKLGEWF